MKKSKSEKELVHMQICQQMREDGYEKKDLVINRAKVTFLSAGVSLVLVVFAFVLYRMLHGLQPDFVLNYFTFLVQLVLSLVIHELVHGITWKISGHCKWNEIEFGLSSLFPYCHCKKPLTTKQYFIGVIMPGILMGFGSLFFALLFENMSLLLLAIINIMVASGDYLIAFSLRKAKGALVIDHPFEAGLVAFIK